MYTNLEFCVWLDTSEIVTLAILEVRNVKEKKSL